MDTKENKGMKSGLTSISGHSLFMGCLLPTYLHSVSQFLVKPLWLLSNNSQNQI